VIPWAGGEFPPLKGTPAVIINVTGLDSRQKGFIGFLPESVREEEGEFLLGICWKRRKKKRVKIDHFLA
jgi:hypothetical protein